MMKRNYNFYYYFVIITDFLKLFKIIFYIYNYCFRRSSIEKHREYKDKYTERDTHKYNTNRSRSRDRDSRKSHSRYEIK